MRFAIIAIMCKLCVRIILASNIQPLRHWHPHSQKSSGVQNVSIIESTIQNMLKTLWLYSAWQTDIQ